MAFIRNFFLTSAILGLVVQSSFLSAQAPAKHLVSLPCAAEKEKLAKIVDDNLYIKRYTVSHSSPENENGIWTIRVRLINGARNLKPAKKINLQKIGQPIIDGEINFTIHHQLEPLIKKQFPQIRKRLESYSADPLERIKKSVVGVGGPEFFGSGVIIHKWTTGGKFKYLVITAYHVVVAAGTAIVLPLESGYTKAKFIGGDPKLDLAILEFTSDIDLPKAQLADLEKLPTVLLGTNAIAIGFPENKSRAFEPRVSSGKALTDSIFTCPIFNGNSGGGFFVKEGDRWKLLTICTMNAGIVPYGIGPSPEEVRSFIGQPAISSFQKFIEGFIRPYYLLLPR